MSIKNDYDDFGGNVKTTAPLERCGDIGEDIDYPAKSTGELHKNNNNDLIITQHDQYAVSSPTTFAPIAKSIAVLPSGLYSMYFSQGQLFYRRENNYSYKKS